MTKKFIVITGASSGFGAEMAKQFHSDGHNLLLLARRVDKMESLGLKGAMIKKVDVSNFDEFDNAVQEGISKFGPVDVMINNAGVMLLGYMGTQSRKDYETMIDVNIKGVLNGIETVVSSMKERQSGTIVNVSSVAGLRPSAEHTVYGLSKYAVRGLSENIRMELAPYNVRVINVNPGAFTTELLEHTSDQKIIDGYNKWKAGMGKMASPAEVAKAIKYAVDAPQELTIAEITLYSTKQGN